MRKGSPLCAKVKYDDIDKNEVVSVVVLLRSDNLWQDSKYLEGNVKYEGVNISSHTLESGRTD